MAEEIILKFDLKEIAAALMRDKRISEGRWIVEFQFNYATVYAGPSPEEVRQTIALNVSEVHLRKVNDDEKPPESLVFDASVLNPANIIGSSPKKGRP